MTIASQHSILLEAGTNEFEILVFKLAKRRCGVNVAKVREVIEPLPVTRLPEAHRAVIGVFQLRGVALPLINLNTCLGTTACCEYGAGKIIILEYNDTHVAFLVDEVEYIHRVKVSDVEALPDIECLHNAPVTFVAHIQGDLVQMVDFEKLVFEIAGIDPFCADAADVPRLPGREGRRILLAEDSPTIRKMIQANLAQSGYSEVVLCPDGQEAWDQLQKEVADQGVCGFDLIITDIEMPRMDGLHLTRRIKSDDRLKHVPVVVFSSLVSVDNDKKCKSVGADAQITKPQLAGLVGLLDGLLGIVAGDAQP